MNLLIAADLSESTNIVVEKSIEIIRMLSARVWLLHVAEPDPDFIGFDPGPQSVRNSIAKEYAGEHRQIQEIADRFRKAGMEATALLMQGPTVEKILEQAGRLDASMIIMGSHGHGAMYQLLVGSTSEGVLRSTQCPVLVIPTHGRTDSARAEPANH
jgi:nucleotide-binding universal stress UspA family protein